MSDPYSSFTHTTVLLHEAVEGLCVRPDGVYVDGTFGRGGHSRLLLERLGKKGRLLAFDRDLQAVNAALTGPDRLNDERFSIRHTAFSQLAHVLEKEGIPQIDGILLDIGVSSPQIDHAERGFSFRLEGPLDMRMDTQRGETVAEFLARADEKQIAQVIRDYGDDRFASQIARALVARRNEGRPVRTTTELAALVSRMVKTREPGQDPATRTFQALRIFVNAELEELQQVLESTLSVLAPGGRLVVISFHSLEDRIVKTFMARESKAVFDRRAPFASPQPMRLKSIARIKPGPAEIKANRRSRSAVMRVAERTDAAFLLGEGQA
ncbi:MAG: 16S rRNA (cytosine(1402)-N(4))-methyltransferase RsmH [Burkholderiales bacterium]